MSNEDPKRPWEQQLREAATHLEDDLRRFAGYVNDEIVPNHRRTSSEALAAPPAELNKLAQRMDDQARRTPPPPPSPPPQDVPKRGGSSAPPPPLSCWRSRWLRLAAIRRGRRPINH